MALNKFIPLFLPFVLLCVGLYLIPLNIFDLDFSKIPGNFGDARFNNYILEHDYLYFIGQVDKYWDAQFMYPFKNVIAFSDNLLGTAPIYAVFRLIGADRETAFQYWLIILFALNFICCYWALYKWSDNNVLSSTGAYIFSFSILLVGNIYNVQTIPKFLVPLVFYWCWKYFTQKEIKYFLFLSLGVIFQFYCGIYLGFLLLYALLFLFIAYVIIYRDFTLFRQFKKRKIIGNHLIVLIIICCLFIPFILPYIFISQEAGIPSFEEVKQYIPTLRSYFFTSKAPILWTALSEHAVLELKNWWCHFLFIGALPWLGIIAVPIVFLLKKTDSNSKKFIAFLCLGLFLSFIFCLNINGFTLYKYIYELPGFAAIRSINRLINIEIMFFVLIFVFVFKELSNYSPKMNWFVLCFPLFVILDNAINSKEIMKYDKKESQNQIERVRKEIQSQYNNKYKAIAYMSDSVENKVNFHIDVMLVCQELNISCVNAYSGHNPGQYNDFFNRTDEESLMSWCQFNNIESESIQRIYPRHESSKRNRSPVELFINLIAFKDKFVGVDKVMGDTLIANKGEAHESERLTLKYLDNLTVVFKSSKNKFVIVDQGESNFLIANVDSLEQATRFVLIKQDSGYFAFMTKMGHYLCSDQTLGGKLIANRQYIGDWEKFRIVELIK